MINEQFFKLFFFFCNLQTVCGDVKVRGGIFDFNQRHYWRERKKKASKASLGSLKTDVSFTRDKIWTVEVLEGHFWLEAVLIFPCGATWRPSLIE